MRIKIIFKCNGEVINKHSDGKNFYGWCNPFGEHIPLVGDFIELGEHSKEFKHLEYTPMKTYVVKSRTFSAIEDYNHSYSSQTCVIELEEIN